MSRVKAKVVDSVNSKTFRAFYNEGCRVPNVFRGDRLSELMEAKGLSQSELARRIGVSQATIWKLVKEPAQGSKHTHKIARELGTSAEYLMGETADPGAGTIVVTTLAELDPDDIEIDSIDLAYGMGGTFLDIGEIEVERAKFSRSWIRQFTNSPPQMLFSTRGAGDSMMPTIHDRDVVIVDRSQSRPEMGDKIWAIVFGGVGMIKRLRPMPDGTVKISSDNQSIRDEIASDGDLFIVGRVCAIVRSV